MLKREACVAVHHFAVCETHSRRARDGKETLPGKLALAVDPAAAVAAALQLLINEWDGTL